MLFTLLAISLKPLPSRPWQKKRLPLFRNLQIDLVPVHLVIITLGYLLPPKLLNNIELRSVRTTGMPRTLHCRLSTPCSNWANSFEVPAFRRSKLGQLLPLQLVMVTSPRGAFLPKPPLLPPAGVTPPSVVLLRTLNRSPFPPTVKTQFPLALALPFLEPTTSTLASLLTPKLNVPSFRVKVSPGTFDAPACVLPGLR